MFNCGHVNEEPAWQGDVRSDPRTFFGDWFLGNLHQNFLALTKQVGDGWLVAITTGKSASLSSAPRTAFVSLLACRLARRSLDRDFRFYNFGSSLHLNVFAV